MLERVLLVRHIVVVVVGVGKESVAHCENIRRTQVRRGQMCLSRVADFKHLTRLIAKVLAQFIAEIGVRIAVTDNLYRAIGADTSMICGDNDMAVNMTEHTEKLGHPRMSQPTLRDAAVCTLIVCKLTDHA